MKNKFKAAVCVFAIGLFVFLMAGCGENRQPADNITEEVMSAMEDTEEETHVMTGNEVIDGTADMVLERTDEQERAHEILDSMTLEEKVGQMFFVRHSYDMGEKWIEDYNIGGYIMFGTDFENSDPDAFRSMVSNYNEISKYPLLIGVDEEGGTVVRASKYPQFRAESFKSPRELYNEGGMELVAEDIREKSLFLKDLGINVNLAPVCDICLNEESFMYDRSIGLYAHGTAMFAVKTVNEMREAGIGSVLKHFPGYGENGDTHTGIAVDDRSLEYLSENDLVPFAAAIENGCGAILVSHNTVNAFDSENPATLSEQVHLYLRNEMGFNGVIMTDDMAMGAISDYSVGDAAVRAVLAGNDILITSDIETQYNAVMEALSIGEIGDNRIDESTYRVVLWKVKMGIIE